MNGQKAMGETMHLGSDKRNPYNMVERHCNKCVGSRGKSGKLLCVAMPPLAGGWPEVEKHDYCLNAFGPKPELVEQARQRLDQATEKALHEIEHGPAQRAPEEKERVG